MRFLTLELEPGPDGTLTDAQLDELRGKMNEVIDTQVPETAREEARRRADELVEELRGRSPSEMSAMGVFRILKECLSLLERLPRAVRGIAQQLDTPSHIFALGGAASELIIAKCALVAAQTAMEELLKCQHCESEPTPDPKRGQA